MARVGYGARGFTYLIIGIYALLAAFNLKSIVGTKGAIKSLEDLPFGSVFVILLSCGFIMYSVWRLAQSFLDADNLGTSFKGIIIRFGLLGSALSYLVLSYWTLAILVFEIQKESSSSISSFLDNESLQYILVVVSVLFLAIAILQIYRGISKDYSKLIRDCSLHPLLDLLCQLGLICRGISFGIFSYYLFRVGIDIFDADKSQNDLKASLGFIEKQPFGEYLVGLMGLGVVAYGIYSLIISIYREFESDSL